MRRKPRSAFVVSSATTRNKYVLRWNLAATFLETSTVAFVRRLCGECNERLKWFNIFLYFILWRLFHPSWWNASQFLTSIVCRLQVHCDCVHRIMHKYKLCVSRAQIRASKLHERAFYTQYFNLFSTFWLFIHMLCLCDLYWMRVYSGLLISEYDAMHYDGNLFFFSPDFANVYMLFIGWHLPQRHVVII